MARRIIQAPIPTLILLGLLANAAAADVVTVPVDLGAEEFAVSPVTRLQVDFAGDQAWPAINGVQLRLVGDHTCQYGYCAEHTTPMVGPLDAGVAYGFMVGETEVFRAVKSFGCVPSPGEAIDLVLDFNAPGEPDWSFLADGTGTLFVEHARVDDSCMVFPIYVGEDVRLTAVEVLVDLPQEVPADRATWGTIKASYR